MAVKKETILYSAGLDRLTRLDWILNATHSFYSLSAYEFAIQLAYIEIVEFEYKLLEYCVHFKRIQCR